MKKLNPNSLLSRAAMKQIVGGEDGPYMPAMCDKCIEQLYDPYHVLYYAFVPCVEWHCPTQEPVPVPWP